MEEERGGGVTVQREDGRQLGSFDGHHLIFVFQLLGQAARNMVLQEDSILHSEDVRTSFHVTWILHAWLVWLTVKENSLSFSFPAEFEENGHHHHTSSVPVSVCVLRFAVVCQDERGRELGVGVRWGQSRSRPGEPPCVPWR